MKGSKKGWKALLVAVTLSTAIVACVYTIRGYYKIPADTGSTTVNSTQGSNSNAVSVGKARDIHVHNNATNPLREEPAIDQFSKEIPSGLRLLEVDVVHGTEVGYTRNYDENPLLAAGVRNITGVVLEAEYSVSPVGHFHALAVIQRLVDGSAPLIHSCKVVVSEFKEMPPFVCSGAAMGDLDAIDAAFLLKKRSAELPWEFDATHYRVVKTEEAGESGEFSKAQDILPIAVTDSVPKLLRLWFSAGDPGIYWVNCTVKISDGAHKESIETLEVFNEPIPLAFYQPEASLSLENKQERLKALESSREWVVIDSEW